jgi:hypothetical protein
VADDKDKSPSCSFEVEFTIKPAKKKEPKSDNTVFYVCVIIAVLLFIWLFTPSLHGGAGNGPYPTAIPNYPQYQAPSGGSGP